MQEKIGKTVDVDEKQAGRPKNSDS